MVSWLRPFFENKNDDRSIRETLRQLPKKLFLLLFVLLNIFVLPPLLVTLHYQHKAMVREVLTSNLSYIRFLLSINDIIELNRHFLSIVEDSAIDSVRIETGSPNERVTIVSASPSPHQTDSLAHAPKPEIFSVKEESTLYLQGTDKPYVVSWRYSYPFTIFGVVIFATWLLLLVIVGVLSYVFIQISKRVAEPFESVSAMFDGFDTHSLKWNAPSWISPLDVESLAISEKFETMVTKLKAAEQAKKDFVKQQALMQLSRQVAHDIRSPLSALRTVVETSEGFSTEKFKVALKAVNRIDLIASDLLTKSRSTAQAVNFGATSSSCGPLQLQRVDLKSAIEDVIEEARAKWHSKDTTIRIMANTDEVVAPFYLTSVSTAAIQRALSNLINNSAEAIIIAADSSNRRRIDLDVEIQSDFFRVYIRDTGPGIPDVIKGKLLDGVEVTTKPHGNGIGFGSVARRLRGAKGDLKIVSTGERGTTVAIELPWYSEEHGTAKPSTALPQVASS